MPRASIKTDQWRLPLFPCSLSHWFRAARRRLSVANPQIAGTCWGNSERVLKNGACQDETNVYRFSEVATRPGWFSGLRLTGIAIGGKFTFAISACTTIKDGRWREIAR
jgi:hypothetical protein